MKRLVLVIIILSTVFTAGCWDMVEINNRVFPYSIGYDLNNSEDERYIITLRHPNINALGKNPSSDVKAYVVSTTANNGFDAIHKLTTKMQQPIYLKHLKVVVLAEEVAKQDKLIREIADGISRDFIINKNVQMVVVKEGAKSLLETTLKSNRQEMVEGLLNSLLINQQESTLFTPITLGNFVEDIDISNSAIMPVASPGNEEIIISGGAIFKDYKLIGYLDPMENRAIAYLNNLVNSDGIDTEYKGADLSLLITSAKSKKALISEDENIKIRFDIELEGHIHEFILDKDMKIDSKEILEDMQNHVAKEIKQELEKTIEKVQKEYKADVIFIGDYIRKFHPKVWNKIKDNWEEIYPEIEIEVDVKMFIRRRGLTK